MAAVAAALRGWRAVQAIDLVWAIPLAIAVVVGIVAGFEIRARHRLANLEPGERWSGSVAVDIGSWRTCPSLASSAPRPGLRSAFLLNGGLATGVLVIEADGLSWHPGLFARWCGAGPWRLPRTAVAAVESSGRKLRIRTATCTLEMRAVASRGLPEALAGLKLTN